MEDKLTYISLFSSAGVGCYGFKQEGFDCIATNEIIERRLEVQKANSKCLFDKGYIKGDILSNEVHDKIHNQIDFWRNKFKIKDVDVLIATPPCQGMSVANHKKNNELSRNSLIIESIKLTKEILPRFFIFENVRAFLKTNCLDLDGTEKSIEKAIEKNLGGEYNIISKIINFKDYGVHSSRTRTLVLGVRKDIEDISPYSLFPEKEKCKTIREIISYLPKLEEMGDIFEEDIFHNFKKYEPRMMEWVRDIKEGQSAFENSDSKKRPHRVINGKIVYNKNKNGDKYRRCYWDQIAPCIHTRNDIFASQSTIHPRDNRVFSVRELMKFMTIPTEFKWTKEDLRFLNSLSKKEKERYLSENEINIRQSIGEAVPTLIFRKIAKKIKESIFKKRLSKKEVDKLIEERNLNNLKNLLEFINEKFEDYDYQDLSKIVELSNAKRLSNAAYYTPKNICYSLIKDLPTFKNLKEISILEPAVGVGNFIPSIIEKYRDKEKINIDVVDIDLDSITLLKILLKKINPPENVNINFINGDFLLTKFNKKYELIIGNPPFKKVTKNPELLKKYKKQIKNKKTNNLFSFFIEKAIGLGGVVSFIVPKSLLSTPEFNKTREYINKFPLTKIIDYGERAFEIKIETISFILDKKKLRETPVKIESYITNEINFKNQDLLCDSNYPSWLIYRDTFFDKIAAKMTFNIFQVFRDRQITTRMYDNNGKIRVLKSRNIESNNIRDVPEYDSYINEIESLAVKKFFQEDKVVLVPNLTYNPRACFKPKNCIVNGSVAILIPKNPDEITKEHLDFYNTEEFKKFYSIARNLSTRSMNIDSNAVFFFGKLNEN